MENNDLVIVKVTNISNKDFSAETGARYNGRDYSIPAGKSLLCPVSLGEHLAKHLARMIMLQNASIIDKNIESRDLPIWSEESEKDLIGKIMTFVTSDEPEVKKTEDDILKERVDRLNKDTFSDDEDDENDIVEVKTDENGSVKYSDKAEVISELEKRGIAFNPRNSKAVLEKLLEDK